eukprot:7790982-Ditylum_brightwellii.AAC.1
MMPNEGDQMETDKSEVAQQSTYDISYPSCLTVRWNQNEKTVLAIVIGPADNSKDDLCKMRVISNAIEESVPISTLSSVNTTDPADIPQHSANIDPNVLESMTSKEDLELLWHKDQITLSPRLRLYLYWHQRLQHPSHVTMHQLIQRGTLPPVLKQVKKAPP